MKQMQEAMARPEMQQQMAEMQAYMQNQQVQQRMQVSCYLPWLTDVDVICPAPVALHVVVAQVAP